MTAPTTMRASRLLNVLPIDLGVALVFIVALVAALAVRSQAVGHTTTFSSPDAPITFSYPADWREAGTLDDTLLNVEDPFVDSAFKTRFTVTTRQLDPASAPPLEELTNRQITDRSILTGYHFLASGPAKVANSDASVIEYAYTVQPIDEPRRASLPVVVQAREYIVRTADRSYYFALAAPAADYAQASAALERIIASVKL